MKPTKNNKQQQPKSDQPEKQPTQPAKEYGGRKGGLDPTRYGDWEKNGRCIDF